MNPVRCGSPLPDVADPRGFSACEMVAPPQTRPLRVLSRQFEEAAPPEVVEVSAGSSEQDGQNAARKIPKTPQDGSKMTHKSAPGGMTYLLSLSG